MTGYDQSLAIRREFRMALLSGEVETLSVAVAGLVLVAFRMALLSGEVETRCCRWAVSTGSPFRMALLSGEVETMGAIHA